MTEVANNITLADLDKLKGYVEERTKSPYEVKRLRNKDHLLILYATGKLVVQGSNSPFPTESKQAATSFLDMNKSIGSDETLKGDTFGGLVVAGAYFEEGEIDVKDSKTYTDEQIQEVADSLLQKYPERFVVKELTPQEYNQLYSETGSQTAILNILHREVGYELKKTFPVLHVVDKYPGCIVGDISESQAESKLVSVAAASIIARNKAIKQFETLSEEAGFTLPKGSSHVKEALAELKKRKHKIDLFCKVHFSNVKNA